MDGKTYHVPDGHTNVVTMRPVSVQKMWVEPGDDPFALAPTKDTYVMKMWSFQGRSVPCIDTKGRVIFEWTEKPRTKWKGR